MRIFRGAGEPDVEQLVAFEPDPGLQAIDRDRSMADFAEGRMRAAWSWLVEDDGVLVARALWWGKADGSLPIALDALDVAEHVDDPASVAVELLAAARADLVEQGAKALPGYTMQPPCAWRDDAVASRAVAWRRDACRRSGLTEELERLQHAWSPGAGVPAASTRLVFRAGSDEEFLDLFAQAARGSLDVETQQAVEAMGEQA